MSRLHLSNLVDTSMFMRSACISCTVYWSTLRCKALDFGKLHFWMSALKFINSSYQQKSSTKQSLHNNQDLGHTMYQKLFQIQWTNKAKQFREQSQHFVSHSFNALLTLLTKHPAKRNYEEPTRLETNSKNILSKTKTVNPEAKFQHKIKIGNILYPEFGNELLNTWHESPKKIEWGLGIWNNSSKHQLFMFGVCHLSSGDEWKFETNYFQKYH